MQRQIAHLNIRLDQVQIMVGPLYVQYSEPLLRIEKNIALKEKG